jgi:hypothetical protein
MEALTRLVADSLARHGLDRPVDPRRLQWSRWFRCDSTHSLLVVPSKPGIFALAEEVMDLNPVNAHVGTAPQACPEQSRRGCPAEQSSAAASSATTAEESTVVGTSGLLGGAALQRCDSLPGKNAASAAEVPQRRMLAVLQFSEDDDMAFTLDRMFTQINPMRARLASGRCFLRFVVIEDQAQRRSICAALNQWMLNSAEKATGLPPDFSSSLELNRVADAARVGAGDSPAHERATARVGRTLLSDSVESIPPPAHLPQSILQQNSISPVSHLDSGTAKNLHCPHPLPSGF